MEEDEKLFSRISPEIGESDEAATSLLPQKSKILYEKEYAAFTKWTKHKNADNLSEEVLLEYFLDKSKRHTASSLWTYFSKLKATLAIKNNINISKFNKLMDFIRTKTASQKPKKPKILRRDHIETFVREAPDDTFLMIKVAGIIGFAGACRLVELTKLTVDDIEDLNHALMVNLRKTKTQVSRTFTVVNNNEDFLGVYRKYAALRPQTTHHKRFFLSFRNGTCSTRPVGKNTFGVMPALIAEYLNLPNHSSYNGRCFRHSSATLLYASSTNNTEPKPEEERSKPSFLPNPPKVDSIKHKIKNEENEEKSMLATTSEKNCENINVDTKQSQSLIPVKSKMIYEKEYMTFSKWFKLKNVENLSEDVILEYFLDRSQRYQASTLWNQFSMLKATLLLKHNIDISKFNTLIKFLKRKSAGYKPKRPKLLTKDHIAAFIREAPDDPFLMSKVALIIGIAGSCRRYELTMLTVDDIVDLQSTLVVNIRGTKSKISRTFSITNNSEDYLGIYRKYAVLRPQNTDHKRFFVTFKNGRCSTQPVGKNRIGLIPSNVAEYLKLPDYSSYTGHFFRCSAILLADSKKNVSDLKRDREWESSTTTEGYFDNSNENNEQWESSTAVEGYIDDPIEIKIKTEPYVTDNTVASALTMNNFEQNYDSKYSQSLFHSQVPVSSLYNNNFSSNCKVDEHIKSE